jgi:hypothetical protein
VGRQAEMACRLDEVGLRCVRHGVRATGVLCSVNLERRTDHRPAPGSPPRRQRGTRSLTAGGDGEPTTDREARDRAHLLPAAGTHSEPGPEIAVVPADEPGEPHPERWFASGSSQPSRRRLSSHRSPSWSVTSAEK